MTDAALAEPGERRSDAPGRWLTAAFWTLGIALQFATPLLRDRVPLSDELFVGSFLAPWWSFLQVALLAGALRLLRGPTASWERPKRIAAGIAAGLFFAVAQPELITQVIAPDVPLGDDPLRVALLWSTPLAFYVVPAAIVVYAWVRRDARLSLTRALGIGLVVIGVLSFPYILWLTHLWDVYVRTSGGGMVLAQ